MRPLTLFLHLLSNISILLLGCARAKIITEFSITVGNSDAQDSNSHRPKPTPQSSDALAQRNHPQRTMHPLGIVANEYLSRTGKINLVLVPIDFADLTGFPHPNGNDGLLSLFGGNGAFDAYLRNMSNLDAFFEVSATKLTRSELTAQSIANSGDVRPLFNEIYTRLSALQDVSFTDLYVLCTKQITGAATTSIRAWSHVEYGIWVNGYYSQPPYRELANLLGVGRADSRSAAGQVMAYGNQLDGAGSPFGYLNTVFGMRCKLEAGWLQDELQVITTFRNSGTYRLYTHDRNPSHSHRAIRLGFPGHKKYFFLEYRSFGGEGNAGNLLYPNERPANLTVPLVQGASLLWGYRNNPNTVLLNAATTGGQDGFNTPIPVGTSFDIHVNFDSTKPVYATVNVVGTGGSEDTSYLDVQITFASTPYCPFSPSGVDLCPTDIHAYEFGDTSTRQPLQIIQYAIKFSVYPHVRLTKLLNFWFNPEIPTCVDTLTVYIYDDSTTSTPGVLRVSDALVVANGTMSIRAGSPLSNFDSTTQLTYGNYWMAFKYTTTQSSTCNFYSLPMPPNGAPTYAQGSNGSWFPTAFQLNLGFDFASEPINLPVDRIVYVRSYPTRLSAGKNFDTVVQYQNSLRFPAFLAAPGHISISARRKSDDVPINIGGVLELDTPTYSSSVTAINLLINEEGEFTITFRDTTFKLNSQEPPTANATPPLDTNFADVTPAAAIQYLGANLTPTIRILQPLPSAITFSLNNSAGSRDTASANKIIRATESSGVLQNVQVPVTNGVAQFTNLQFAHCPAGNAAFVTFSLTDDPNVTTSLTMVVDTSLLGNWVLRFGDTADSSVTNGLKKLSVGVSENDSSLPVTVEATRGCDVDTTVNNVVITLTPTEPTAQLQNNVATMSDGVASFPNLSITFAGTIQQTQIVATPTWGPGGSGTLPNAITSEMNVQEVQEFTSIAIQLPSETFVLSQNQEVTPPIQIRALRSDGSLDKTFSGLVQVSIPDITLVGANATAVDGVAALTGLTMISCAPEVPVEMTVVATSGSGAMLQKTIPIQAQSQLGSNVVITSIPRQIPQYRPFSAILTIEDPCGARDTTANNMIATASVSEGSITGNVATVVTGVAYFPSIVLSNITDTTASIMFQITSANPSDPTLPMFNNGDDISVLIGTESNAVPRGPSASDLSLPRSQEFAVLLTQSDPVTFLLSEYISLLMTALFTVPEPSDVHLEITAQLWGAPTIIRHRCVFSQNATIPITLPATSVDSELPVVLDVQDMPTLNQNLIELHRRVFLTANNTLQDYGVPAGGATPLPLCPSDTCSAWGLAQRAPTLDADTCICTCSNFWGGDKCGSCLIEYLDSACLDCEFPGGEAPDCPSTSNAPGTYNPKTMSRGVMIGVGAAIGIVIAGGAILFFMKPPEEVPTF